MATVVLSPIETFLPIIAFLFVFILIYALLKKTAIVGDNSFVAVFLSFAIAAFFIVNAQLVDFVKMSASWAVVFVICLFLILVFIGLAGKDSLGVVQGNKSLAWVLMGVLIIVFIVGASYVFNWALNWDMIKDWFDEPWFGTVVLLILAAIVAKVIIPKK